MDPFYDGYHGAEEFNRQQLYGLRPQVVRQHARKLARAAPYAALNARRASPGGNLADVKVMDNRRAAVQLLEVARKHLDQFTLWGAVFYVYNSAQERKLPWATPETLKLAEDAFDQAIRSWLGDRLNALSRFRTGRALLEEAACEGRDPLRDAVMYLNQSTQ